MIISKGRRSLNCSIPNNIQDFTYINKAQSKNKYQSSYLAKQRHSISTISPITKNRQIDENNFYKSNDKKYNYSINIEPDLNQSYDRNNHSKQAYMMQSIERKRPELNQKFNVYPKNNQIVNKRNISCQNTQKIPLNNYLQQQNKSSYKQRSSIQKNKQNKLQLQNLRDEFYRTDKLKQYSTNVKNRRALQQQNSRAKYQSKYLQKKSRNTQEIVQQQHKVIEKNKPTQIYIKNQVKTRNPSNQVIRHNIIQESEQQSRNIHQKISNISKLNEQINARLQRMLLKKYKH